jgi:transposase
MSALTIAPYLPFRRVRLMEQTLVQGIEGCSSVIIELAPDRRYAPLCSACGCRLGRVHARATRWVRDLKLAEHEVLLEVPHRRCYCRTCQRTRAEALDFVARFARVTTRLARFVAELCKVLSVTDVARHLRLDWKLVKRCDRAALEAEFGETKTGGLRLLAVDEIAIKKGHRYMTVVLDYETGRVVWLGEGRKTETLAGFFKHMTAQERAQVEAVAMDMWRPFEQAVRENLPNARIIYDLFHVVATYSREVLDPVRTAAYRQAADSEERRFIKGSRFVLYKNEENLTPAQRPRLHDLLRVNEDIATAYLLKDALKEIWRTRRPWAARRALRRWCELATESGLKPLIRFADKLLRHARGIIAHAVYPIHTSRLEGINNRIKVLKRVAYGFHDPVYFSLKVKQAFPGQVAT